MYKAISNNVQITVMPEFLPDQSDPEEERFFWAYTIEIVNLGHRTVQLMSRHWHITDGRGRLARRDVREALEQFLIQAGMRDDQVAAASVRCLDYFNHRSGKAEKCTLCEPRSEQGQPTICSETCVGRIRYLGFGG